MKIGEFEPFLYIANPFTVMTEYLKILVIC